MDDPLFPTVTRRVLSLRLRELATSLGFGEGHRMASHSLRRGGATSLLASGVAPHVIQRFGRWASDMWVETYAELQFDQQLAMAVDLDPRATIPWAGPARPGLASASATSDISIRTFGSH